MEIVANQWHGEDLPILGFTEEGRRITSRVWRKDAAGYCSRPDVF
jgi:hypothetical protein